MSSQEVPSTEVETSTSFQSEHEPFRLPELYTPEQVATHFGWSERKLRAFAREIGACRVLGNHMVMTKQDVDAILEAAKPEPVSAQGVQRAYSGRGPGALTDWEELLIERGRQQGLKEAAKAKREKAR